MAEDPRAILAVMAERERKVTIGHVRDPKDVPRLLAAVEVALKPHAPGEPQRIWPLDLRCPSHDWTRSPGRSGSPDAAQCPDCSSRLVRFCPRCMTEYPCADVLAVLAALTGKGGTDA